MQLTKLLSVGLLIAGQASGAYQWRRSITINHSQVPSTQTNFPIVVTGTLSYLATVANGGQVQNSSGFDILFTSDLAGTSPLTCEQVVYVATSGKIEYWLNIASLSGSSDTVIYMFYGNSAITTTRCASPSSVWDSHFKLVMHLPDGSTLSANDSTSNANNGTINSVVAIAAAFDGGADFGLANNGHHIDTSFVMPTTNFTYSIWINGNGSGGLNVPFGAADFTAGLFGTALVWNASNGITQVASIVFRQGTNTGVGDMSFIPSSFIGTHYVAVTMDSTLGGAAFHNGAASVATNATYKSITTGGAHVWLGRDQNQTSSAYQGWLDEVRISDIVRSNDWLTVEFNNQNVATFYTLGPPVATSGVSSFSIVY